MNNIYEKVLFNFQKEAFNFLLPINKHLIALDMGLGKTILSLAILKSRLKNFKRKIALILCQKSKLLDWQAEVKKHFKNFNILLFQSENITIKQVLQHRKDLSSKDIPSCQKRRLKLICDAYLNKNVIVISTYTIARLKSDYLNMLFNGSQFILPSFPQNMHLIIDESQVMKSRTSRIGIWGEQISKNIKYVSLLSGDPISNSYIDLYQQMQIMDYKLNWNTWAFKFCVYEQKTSYKNSWYEFIGFKNIKELLALLNQKSYFLKTWECIEKMPEQNFQVIKTIDNYYMLSVLKKHYWINENSYQEPQNFFLAQRQLASGFLGDKINIDDQKLNIVFDLLKSTEEPFVIF